MKKGFIIFLTHDWLPLVTNLINSVLLFSKYELEVNCINFEYNFNNSRIKSKTLQLNLVDFFNITKCKIIATKQTEFDYALLLDGDMIVTPDIDKIFDDNETRIQECDFPLFTKHSHNCFDRWNHIVSRISTKPPKMKWVYSNYLFLTKHKWFLEEIFQIMNNIPDVEHSLYYPVPEESIINALLAKYEVNYDLGYNYLPNGYKYVVNEYLYGDEEGKQEIKKNYEDNGCPVKIYAFHSHDIKDIEYGKLVIKNICDKFNIIDN